MWTASFGTAKMPLRADGAGLHSLARNIGSSVGISVVNALLTRNIQINHASASQHITAASQQLAEPAVAQFWNPMNPAGAAALNAEITRQSSTIAYMDGYKLLMIATIAVMPILVIFRKPRPTLAGEATGVVDH